MRLLKALLMGTAIMIMSQVVMATDIAGAQEPREPEYREPPYANLFPATSVDEELWDIEEFFEGGDDSRSASCSDHCHYHTSLGENVEIHCEVPSTAFTNVVVGMNRYVEAGESVIMCHYEPLYGWVRIGFCDLDGVVKLLVDGSSDADKIGIIKNAVCENGEDCYPVGDCDFGDFIDDFDWETMGRLAINGQGQYDEIWGSQYGDAYLKGEYVNGKQGDDWIFLSTDNCNTPIGVGGEGSDRIYGTSKDDDIWADDVGMPDGAGSDNVEGYGGNDYIYLGYGDNDIGYGGTRSDEIWGGPGDNDHLYGEEHNDYLKGGTGEGDYCHGGLTSWGDHCDVECETRIACNAW